MVSYCETIENEFSETTGKSSPAPFAAGHSRREGSEGILRRGQCRDGPPQNASAKQSPEGVSPQPQGKTIPPPPNPTARSLSGYRSLMLLTMLYQYCTTLSNDLHKMQILFNCLFRIDFQKKCMICIYTS